MKVTVNAEIPPIVEGHTGLTLVLTAYAQSEVLKDLPHIDLEVLHAHLQEMSSIVRKALYEDQQEI